MSDARETVARFTCYWSGVDSKMRESFDSVPCCGAIDVGMMLEPIWSGKAGVIIVACGAACHHRKGSCQAAAAADAARGLLSAAGIRGDRIRLLEAPKDGGLDRKEYERTLAEVEALGGMMPRE